MIIKLTLKCKKCGKEYTISCSEASYRRGVYRKHCSLSCANSRGHSKETREKISHSVRNYFKSSKYLEKWEKDTEKLNVLQCKNCGKQFNIRDKRDTRSRSYCSLQCKKEFYESNIKPHLGGKRRGSGRGKKGWYKGIFCDSTWELAFVIYCLDNDISIKRNKEFRTYIYKGKEHKYYPDFIINDKDVYEIKGYSTDQWQAKKAQNPDVIVIGKKEISKYLDYCIKKYGIEFWNTLYEENPNNNIEELKKTRQYFWLNNGVKNVFIQANKYDEYIKNEYVRGRLT